MIKKLFAAKELEYLHRLNLAIEGAKQHLGRLPYALPIIHYIEQATRGDVSVNLVTEIRAKLEMQRDDLDAEIESDRKAMINTNSALTDENTKLRAQLAEQTLQATLGWTRYEQANTKHLNLEQQYANLNEAHRQLGINHSLLNEKHQALSHVSSSWYTSLYDAAVLMGVEVTNLEALPSRLREYLLNQNFVFRGRKVRDADDPVASAKLGAMRQALAEAFTVESTHVMPGIPCSSCVECECTLEDGCFLSMKVPNADTRNV